MGDDADHAARRAERLDGAATASSVSASSVPKPSSRKMASSLAPLLSRDLGELVAQRERERERRLERLAAGQRAHRPGLVGVAVVDDDELVLVAGPQRVLPGRQRVEDLRRRRRADREPRRTATSRSGRIAAGCRRGCATSCPCAPRASLLGDLAGLFEGSSMRCSSLRASRPRSTTCRDAPRSSAVRVDAEDARRARATAARASPARSAALAAVAAVRFLLGRRPSPTPASAAHAAARSSPRVGGSSPHAGSGRRSGLVA